MIGRKAIVGLSLLSALLFCALAAQGAAAAEHTSENTTAFTCVEVKPGTGQFEDAHCDFTHPEKKGNFEHELIPSGATEIEVTNEKTLNKTSEAEPATLKGAVPGGKTHIICKTVKGTGTIENGGTGLIHKVTGTVKVEFSNCEVKEPANCKVKEPITATSTFMGVDQMGAEKNTMGVEFEPDAATKEGAEGTFATITYEGEKCALKGKSFPVKGTAIATPGGTDIPKPSPSARESGATSHFEPGNGMQSLKLGENATEFIATVTTRMKGGGNPIALTTTT